MFTELFSLISWSLILNLISEIKQIRFIKSGQYSDEYSPESFLLQLLGIFSRTIWFVQSSEIIFETTSKNNIQTILVLVQFFLNILCYIYKIKLLSKYQKQSLKNPVSLTKIAFVGLIISLCVQELSLKHLINKVALFCFTLESSQYMPQLYHSRNDLISSNRRSFCYTPYQLVSIILRIIFWIIIYNKFSISLFLYHFLFDFMNIYFLKDFILAYYFKTKNDKIYFKPKEQQEAQKKEQQETTEKQKSQ
ncbi:hypothetical protein ABPG72_007173 [Tetrahymena utriculariae]